MQVQQLIGDDKYARITIFVLALHVGHLLSFHEL